MEEEEYYDERQERAAWKRYRTGAKSDYDSIKRDNRGYPLFVRGSQISKGWDRSRDEATNDKLEALAADEEGSSRQQSNDMFPAFQHKSGSTEVRTMNIIAAPQNSERGKEVATFYSQLPRETVIEQRKRQSPDLRKLTSKVKPCQARVANKNGSDWFIRKASAQLQDIEAIRSKALKGSASLPSERSCSVCFAPLPIPLNSIQWDAHRSSIAHQLALDGPLEAGSFGPLNAIAKRKKTQIDDKSGKILLKPTNLGYTALERMGWKKGMGLGREEWEYDKRLLEKTRGKRLRGTEDVIVISDSDEDDDLQLEIGSEQWLVRIREEQARLSASRPAASHIEEKQKDIEVEEEEEGAPRSRPLLEPIAVQLRRDRRGIGKALPTSSRFIDGKVQRHTQSKAEAERGKQRLSKSQKKLLEKQKQEEWKQLRNSLN